jgi:3-hydroxybutyrate dehydrogenase
VSPVETFPEDKWDDIIAVCLSSTFHATKAAVPHMLKHGWGRIINTGSMHALVVGLSCLGIGQLGQERC